VIEDQIQALLQKLRDTPENWDLRLEAIELLAGAGRLEEAKALVRDSPDIPVPHHIQRRLWRALSGETQGTPDKAEEKPAQKDPLAEKAPVAAAPAPSLRETLSPESGRPMLRPRQSTEAAALTAGFRLSDLQHIERAEKQKASANKFSSLSLAVAFHLLLAMSFGLVVIYSPQPAPPVITIVAAAESEETPMKTARVQKVEISTPAQPSISSTNVLTVDISSAVPVPKFDDITPHFDPNLVDLGIGNSRGMSFEGEGAESVVSFFGVEGGGRRVIFLLDATPYMLLDEKGGMYAYDKAKNEIGAMLSQMNRGTAFNIIAFQDKRISMFRERPVPALTSNVRRAIEWMKPINQDYNALGLRTNIAQEPIQPGAKPILQQDIAHYGKAIQAALEQDVNSIFCITVGWRGMNRSLSPEDQAKWDEAKAERDAKIKEMGGVKVEYDPKEVAAWKKAEQKARDWLEKENAARKEKGLPPKVVIDFNSLVMEITPGARRPQGKVVGEPPPPIDVKVTRGPAYTPDDVESHVNNVVTARYGKNKPDRPHIYMVLFLGEEEDIGEYEDHFKRLTRRNNGQLKILRGYAALDDVTSK